ncbi:uncharacterized protein [Centruroides vittatus]
MSCSRNKSRLVRNVIEKKFIPVLDRYKVTLPLDCPFHKQRDVFWWPEKNVGENERWICPACTMTFHCEDSLINHWDAMHTADRSKWQSEDAVCLADYCDIMRCDVLGNKLKTQKTKNDDNDQSFNTVKLLELSRSSSDLCNENTLLLLQNKCKAVIRQCTLGLLATLSLKDFHDIEDELNKVVCSYLTCDRFWDDSLQDINQVPILFCLIIGLIMVGGFCLCYYIVWILFDSSPYEEIHCNGLNFPNITCTPRPSIFPEYRYQRFRNNNRFPRR